MNARNLGTSRGTALPAPMEAVIEPDLPIVDAHHHLWDEDPCKARDRYHLKDFVADIESGHNVVKTVFVEAEARWRTDGPDELRSVGETEFAVAMSEEAAQRGVRAQIAAAIVPYADLGLGDRLDAVIDAHEEAAAGRLRGFRDMGTLANRWDLASDPHRLLDDDYRAGLRRVAARGLVVDLYVWQVQLPDVIATARALPEATFVLNHLGGIVGITPWTGRREELFPQWKADMAELSNEPNVFLKLGGMNWFGLGYDWHKGNRLPSSEELVRATGAYYAHGIDRFGPDRCLFESNFSPDALAGSYRTLWNAFKRIAAGCSSAEKAALFSGTAEKVYRI